MTNLPKFLEICETFMNTWICKIFKNTFLTEHLRTTASEKVLFFWEWEQSLSNATLDKIVVIRVDAKLNCRELEFLIILNP